MKSEQIKQITSHHNQVCLRNGSQGCRICGGQAIGLETGTASTDYVSLWDGAAAVLLESLELVQRTASEIIAAITPDKSLPPDSGG